MTTDPTAGIDRKEGQVPDPDDPRKPDKPTELTKRSWMYVLRKTFREFMDDQCTDQAAALTYYSVLSIFPAAIALVSVLGLVGEGENSVNTVMDVLRGVVSDPGVLDNIQPTLEDVASNQSVGVLFLFGLLGAIWTASGYIGAFGRAMNRVYEVAEGRPIWKLRPMQVLITVACILLLAIALVLLAVSGPVAEEIGDKLGVSDTVVTVWSLAKWPVLALVAVLVVALLYYSTPNVKQPKFRWLSMGAVAALLAGVLAALVFSFYVGNFSSYDKTYGSLAGVVIALLFLWIINLALLFGAELDAELERGRQLQAGIAAEEELQLPARDTRGIEKAEKRHAKDAARGRRIREEASTTWPPPVDSDGSDGTNGTDGHDDDMTDDKAAVTAKGRHKENS